MKFFNALGLALSAAACNAIALPASSETLLDRTDKASSLRILSLGASITYGFHSTDGNGYREHLKQSLSSLKPEFVGSQCSGTMENGNNEGHPGYVISQMWDVVQPDLDQRPNVVLLYVGTNDMVRPDDPTHAPERMAQLVQQLAEKLPDALIVVGNLFLDRNSAVQARIEKFNADLPGAINPLQSKGINTVMADFASVLKSSDLGCDGEHPNDVGYARMADVFHQAIMDAQNSGKIKNPVPTKAGPKVCKPLQPTSVPTCK